MGLCKAEDDYIREKLRWIVTLSNGENIYQDDDRPGEDEPKTWLRLKQYLIDNSLKIVGFKIQFCSHIEQAAPENATGYYFAKKIGAYGFGGQNIMNNYYVVGYLDNDRIYTTDWMVPEIIPIAKDSREIKPDDPHLIVNLA